MKSTTGLVGVSTRIPKFNPFRRAAQSYRGLLWGDGAEQRTEDRASLLKDSQSGVVDNTFRSRVACLAKAWGWSYPIQTGEVFMAKSPRKKKATGSNGPRSSVEAWLYRHDREKDTRILTSQRPRMR